MQSVDKDTNVLDDKKEAMVMMPSPEKKLSTTEKVTTSDQVHKRTDNVITIEGVVKVTDEFHKRTDKTTTNEEVDKGTEKLGDMKEAVVTIHRKDSDKFEGQSKGSTGLFNLDHEFFFRNFFTLEPDFYKTLYEKYIEGLDTEPYRKFSLPSDSTKLNLDNINDPV